MKAKVPMEKNFIMKNKNNVSETAHSKECSLSKDSIDFSNNKPFSEQGLFTPTNDNLSGRNIKFKNSNFDVTQTIPSIDIHTREVARNVKRCVFTPPIYKPQFIPSNRKELNEIVLNKLLNEKRHRDLIVRRSPVLLREDSSVRESETASFDPLIRKSMVLPQLKLLPHAQMNALLSPNHRKRGADLLSPVLKKRINKF